MEEIQTFSYTLIRKNVKNINLRVKPDGSIVVSAHPRVSKNYIDKFVQSQAPFIQKARAQMEQKQINTKQQFQAGDQIPYLGDTLILHIEKADRRLIPIWMEEVQKNSITNFSRNNHGEAIFHKDSGLYLYTEDQVDTEHNQQLYDSWQKIQTGILCGQLSRQHYPVFEKLGVIYPEIKIRKMSSRWGSCIPQKNKITFNSLLLEKPLESVEYVVVHEFSHFIHPNHSMAFYHFVEQILPDWKSRKDGLRG